MAIILLYKYAGGTGVDRSWRGEGVSASPPPLEFRKNKNVNKENMVSPHVDKDKGKFVPALN
jgi:hypothetical protein